MTRSGRWRGFPVRSSQGSKPASCRSRTLADTPRPAGMKKLKGAGGLLRLRVGDYRILYEVDDAKKLVTVAEVLHRSKAYRRL